MITDLRSQAAERISEYYANTMHDYPIVRRKLRNSLRWQLDVQEARIDAAMEYGLSEHQACARWEKDAKRAADAKVWKAMGRLMMQGRHHSGGYGHLPSHMDLALSEGPDVPLYVEMQGAYHT